ncbi:hypothetical protein TWF706_009622 [Orbilia oligospora]|nr:hypothetical protein TWF706_009622 [Orbilia oligospora]
MEAIQDQFQAVVDGFIDFQVPQTLLIFSFLKEYLYTHTYIYNNPQCFLLSILIKSIYTQGQKLAEQITTYTLTVSAIVGFLAGFVSQNIVYTLYICLAGTALTFLAVVPPWPFYNQAPVRFLSSGSSGRNSGSGGGAVVGTIVVDGQEVKVKT